MYNEERKKRYIAYKEANTIVAENILERTFRAISVLEERYGKDCCDFTEEEILGFYKMLGTRSVDVITNHNSRLSLYVDWCISQGLVKDGQNHYRTLKRDNFSACINAFGIQVTSFTREEWLIDISALYNAREQFMCLYLFEVGSKDMIDIFHEISLDWFEGNILHLPDRDVTVSDMLIGYAERADHDNTLYMYAPDGPGYEYSVEETGKILKWKKRKVVTGTPWMKSFAGILSKIFSFMGYPTLKAKEVAIMGQIHMIDQLAAKYELTREQVIFNRELFDQVEQQYRFHMSSETYKRRFKGYLE